MPLTPTTVNRLDDPAEGDDFLVLEDGSGRLAQGVALVDEDGTHQGVPGNAVVTELDEPSTRFVSSALAREEQVFTGAGKVREVSVLNTGGSTMYLMLFDQTAALAGGEAPFYRHIVPAGSQLTVEFRGGRTVANGLRAALSSAAVTWTDPTVDEGLFYGEID